VTQRLALGGRCDKVESLVVLHPGQAIPHLTVHTADLSAENPYRGTYLYDGQTREMLAMLTIKNGQKSGMVFSARPQAT
jgi:hypothetical protein